MNPVRSRRRRFGPVARIGDSIQRTEAQSLMAAEPGSRLRVRPPRAAGPDRRPAGRPDRPDRLRGRRPRRRPVGSRCSLGITSFWPPWRLAFVPVGGRNADLWAPITTAFWVRRLSVRPAVAQRRHAPRPRRRRADLADPPRPPGRPADPRRPVRSGRRPDGRGLRRPDLHGGAVGAAGGVRPLRSAPSRPAAWPAGAASCPASPARPARSPRIQWVERTAPADDGHLAPGRPRPARLPRVRIRWPRAIWTWWPRPGRPPRPTRPSWRCRSTGRRPPG